MVAVAEGLIAGGEGTPESEWLPWLASQKFSAFELDRWLAPSSTVVMVAPHPDDEVLAAGGLLVHLAQRGHPVRIVAVTNGEASHGHSPDWPAERLARERPLETRHALECLGLKAEMIRLGLPDGALAVYRRSIAQSLAPHCQRGDLLLTTWRGDGHPDHTATALACEITARQTDAKLVEVPVWAWHWAKPNDFRLPWERACVHKLDAKTKLHKELAVQAFRSQLEPDQSTGRPPVLRASTVERALRPFEVLFA